MRESKGKMIRRTTCGDCGVKEGRLHIRNVPVAVEIGRQASIASGR